MGGWGGVGCDGVEGGMKVDGWVSGWLGGWVGGWVGGWADGWVYGLVGGCVGGWVGVGGWVAGLLGGWVGGWALLTPSPHRHYFSPLEASQCSTLSHECIKSNRLCAGTQVVKSSQHGNKSNMQRGETPELIEGRSTLPSLHTPDGFHSLQ